MGETPTGLTIDALAQTVKSKYPDYANHDNGQLVQALVQKHPEYSQTLHPQELAKITPGAMQTSKGGPIENAATYQPPEGAMGKIGRGGLLGMASGAGIPETQNPVKDLLKGFVSQKPDLAAMLDPTGGALVNSFRIGKAEVGSGQEAYQGIQQRDPEMIAHGVASGITRPAMMLGGGEKAGEALTTIPEQARVGTQKVLGIGPDFVKSGAEKVSAENVEALAKHEQASTEAAAGRKAKIEQAKVSEPQAFADADSKFERQKQTVQQANAESQHGFQERQQHLDIANQHAQAISDSLEPLYQAARKEAGAAYGPQPRGTYEATEIKNLIEDTAKSKLQGNMQMPSAVTKILKDIDQPPEPTLLDQASVFKGAGKQARAAGNLADLSPKARAFMIQNNPSLRSALEAPERLETDTSTGASRPLDASRIHGFMSELGKAAKSGSLNPDETSAINATRTALEGRLRKLYEGEDRLGDFQAGQAKWKQMANTFENASSPGKGGSPIAQALQTKDPVTGKLRPDYVQAALTGDKSFPIAKQMLDRYRHLGAPTSELDVMKTHGDFADTLPNKVKWKGEPAGPKHPNFTEFGTLPKTPEPPRLSNFDPVKARKIALKQKGESFSGTGGPYGVLRDVMGMKGLLLGNPMALSYPVIRRMLGSGVGSEGLIDWLSKPTTEELEMAKDIPAKKVALKQAQGPKQSIVQGGSSFVGPTKAASETPAWQTGEATELTTKAHSVLNDPAATPEERTWAKSILKGER